MEELQKQFAKGRTTKLNRPRRGGQLESAKKKLDEAKNLIKAASGNSDLEAAARSLGAVFEYAHRQRMHAPQAEVLSLLGMAMNNYASADTDKSKDAASKQLLKSSYIFARIGLMRESAIERTNAAVCILEKTFLTDEDLEEAKSCLDFSFIHKIPHTVDWAHSEFNLGLYYKRLRTRDNEARSDNLRRAKDLMTRSMTFLENHGEYQHLSAAIALGQVEFFLYEAVVALRKEEVIRNHIDELPYNIWAIAENSPLDVAGILESNPSALGLANCPDWYDVDECETADDNTKAQITDFLEMLADRIDRDPSVDWSTASGARLIRAKLNWVIEKSAANYNALENELLNSHDTDPESRYYFGTEFAWQGNRHLQRPPSLNALRTIASYYTSVIAGRDLDRLEPFIRSRPPQIRFIACQLCDHGLWEEAFFLLEATRLVLHAPLLTSRAPEASGELQRNDISVLHLTHSPDATYIIARTTTDVGPKFSGRRVEEFSGKYLVRLVSSFSQDEFGLLNAQQPGAQGQLSRSIERSMAALNQIAASMEEIAVDRTGLLIVTGGLYATLPITSAISARSNKHSFVAVIPSFRTLRNDNLRKSPSDASVSLFSAANVENEETLPNADSEIELVANIWREVKNSVKYSTDARSRPFLESAENSDILHFSGHSHAHNWDPRESTIALDDKSVSVRDLLNEVHAMSSLTVLSSCQSAQTNTVTIPDEFLGIQTGFLYAGSRFVVGSLWPVLDASAPSLMARFHWHLAHSSFIDIESVSHALREAQSWMRAATISDIEQLYAEFGMRWNRPGGMVGFDENTQVFKHPRNWAGFYIASRVV
ncbi:CHAT domain-containing protein [Rhodococcus sp. 11-3]|uniref:CHAT domain-containing protein n=1 Tax=Rhodococcus sp. 11-3 TaxID=2854796 RepID=UPI00203FEC4A|nr:CHAT domain-containing protein [Rhodococcus sp. 11-3]USC16246.1 CHAT domain-containing protein [Rhodococcus sp. 11-3]